MSERLKINQNILSEVNSINKACRDMNTSLYFSDRFYLKSPNRRVDADVEFWYAVTNIYCLFFDCAPFIFRKHKYYCRYEYLDKKTKTLLDILTTKNCLSTEKKTSIESYINAISELRSCFSHNKQNTSFNPHIIQRGLGNNPSDWNVFPHLRKHKVSSFNYSEGLCILTDKSEENLTYLREAFISAKYNFDEDDFDSWAQAIAAWYLQSDDVINRCLSRYYDLSSSRMRKNLQIKQWKTQLSIKEFEKKANKRACTKDELIGKCLNNIKEDILYSHVTAYPEVTLDNFLKDMLY